MARREARAAENKVRRICLALPQAVEKETWQTPTFRVNHKIFAHIVGDSEDGRPAVWMKAPPGMQEVLVSADPKRFFRPPYVGHKGWIGVHLDVAVDWEELAALIRDSFVMTAPKRVAALLARD